MSSPDPHTKVKLLSGISEFGKRCGYETWFYGAVLFTILSDTVLVVFQGLDLIHRGTNIPTLQFGFIAGIAILYSLLLVLAIAMHQWERINTFQYRWFFAMLSNTLLSWITFGVYASWIGWYGVESSVSASEGAAFITWIAINALGVVMFSMRIIVIFMACAMYYTFKRVIEIANGGPEAERLKEILDLQTSPETKLSSIAEGGGAQIPVNNNYFSPQAPNASSSSFMTMPNNNINPNQLAHMRNFKNTMQFNRRHQH